MRYEIELSTGKKLTVRKPTIRDRRLALQGATATTRGDNPTMIQAMTQDELLKLLILEENGVKLGASQKEDLDSFLEYGEYQETLVALAEIMGETKAPKVNLLPTTEST